VRISARPLVSFLAAGLLCVGAYTLFHPSLVIPRPTPLVLVMAAYVVVASIVVGLARRRVFLAFSLLWMTAVLLVFLGLVTLDPVPGGVLLGLWVALIYGSLAFALWAVAGAAISAFLRNVGRVAS
jgi:hypothetical protein